MLGTSQQGVESAFIPPVAGPTLSKDVPICTLQAMRTISRLHEGVPRARNERTHSRSAAVETAEPFRATLKGGQALLAVGAPGFERSGSTAARRWSGNIGAGGANEVDDSAGSEMVLPLTWRKHHREPRASEELPARPSAQQAALDSQGAQPPGCSEELPARPSVQQGSDLAKYGGTGSRKSTASKFPD